MTGPKTMPGCKATKLRPPQASFARFSAWVLPYPYASPLSKFEYSFQSPSSKLNEGLSSEITAAIDDVRTKVLHSFGKEERTFSTRGGRDRRVPADDDRRRGVHHGVRAGEAGFERALYR